MSNDESKKSDNGQSIAQPLSEISTLRLEIARRDADLDALRRANSMLRSERDNALALLRDYHESVDVAVPAPEVIAVTNGA
jgi:hypothetical protein